MFELADKLIENADQRGKKVAIGGEYGKGEVNETTQRKNLIQYLHCRNEICILVEGPSEMTFVDAVKNQRV